MALGKQRKTDWASVCQNLARYYLARYYLVERESSISSHVLATISGPLINRTTSYGHVGAMFSFGNSSTQPNFEPFGVWWEWPAVWIRRISNIKQNTGLSFGFSLLVQV